jgi:hypothetical protein
MSAQNPGRSRWMPDYEALINVITDNKLREEEKAKRINEIIDGVRDRAGAGQRSIEALKEFLNFIPKYPEDSPDFDPANPEPKGNGTLDRTEYLNYDFVLNHGQNKGKTLPVGGNANSTESTRFLKAANPLMRAIIVGSPSSVQTLIDRGMDPNKIPAHLAYQAFFLNFMPALDHVAIDKLEDKVTNEEIKTAKEILGILVREGYNPPPPVVSDADQKENNDKYKNEAPLTVDLRDVLDQQDPGILADFQKVISDAQLERQEIDQLKPLDTPEIHAPVLHAMKEYRSRQTKEDKQTRTEGIGDKKSAEDKKGSLDENGPPSIPGGPR